MNEPIVPRKYVVCEDSLHPVRIGEKIAGFSIRLRIPEYRSLPLALIGGFLIRVDGMEYTDYTVTAEGITFRPEEMETVTDIYWLIDEPVTLTVFTQAPLTPGKHAVAAYAGLRISYMPQIVYCGEELEMVLREET